VFYSKDENVAQETRFCEQYLRQNEKHLICRLGGAKRNPTNTSGSVCVPPDLQENGEGIREKIGFLRIDTLGNSQQIFYEY